MIAVNKHIEVSKTARYTLLKSEQHTAKKALIVLHGYGQLSTFFSRKFTEIQSDFDFIIAEGLNRFYLNGSSGRVGASWMTKEDRTNDIKDNHAYLRTLINTLQSDYEEISILGFSQGGSTAARYYCENKSDFKSLILWASVLPPDIDELDGSIIGDNNYFVLGKQDQFFSDEKQKEVLNLHKELKMNVLSFDGGHDIHQEILESILINI